MKKISRNTSRMMKIFAGVAVALTMGLTVKLAIGSSLKAEEPKAFLEVETKTDKLKSDTVIDSKDVTFTLKSNKNRLIEVPDNDAYKIAAVNKEVEEIPQAPSDFSVEKIVKSLEKNTNEKIKDADDTSLVNSFLHQMKEKTGKNYITLVANEPLKLIAHHTKLEEQVAIEATDISSGDKQVLFTFSGDKDAENSEPKDEIKKAETLFPSLRGAQDGPSMTPQPAGDDVGGKLSASIAPEDIEDGSGNLDPDDEPGHDSDLHNKIVRSFDQITYNVAFTIEDASATIPLKNFRYRIDAVYDDARKLEDGILVRRGEFLGGNRIPDRSPEYKSVFTSGIKTVALAGQYKYPVTLVLNGAQNGDLIEPKITVTLVDAEDNNGNKVAINQTTDNLVPYPIKVSSKPNVRAIMSADPQAMMEYDDYAQTTGSKMSMQTVGVSLYIVPLNDPGITRGPADLRGVSYPSGKVTLNGELSSQYIDNANHNDDKILTPSDQPPSQFIDAGTITLDANGENPRIRDMQKTAEFQSANLKNDNFQVVGRHESATISTTKKGTSEGMYDSGHFTVQNTTPNNFRFSFDNYQRNSDSYKSLNMNGFLPWIGYRQYFASGYTNVTIPYQYMEDKEGNTKTRLTIKTLTYSVNGEEKILPNDGADPLDVEKTHYVASSLTNFGMFLSENKGSLGSNTNSDVIPSGDEKTFSQRKIWYSGRGESSSLKYRASELIMSWNPDTFTYDNSRKPELRIGISPSVPAEKVAEKWGVLKSGNFSLDNQYDHVESRFNWYNSPEEALTHGEISAYYTKTKKNDNQEGLALINQFLVPLIVSSTKLGAINEKGTANVGMTTQRMLGVNDTKLDIQPQNPTVFKPTVYNEDGTMKENQIPNNLWGDTLYLIPLQSRLDMSTPNVLITSDQDVNVKMEPKIEVGTKEYNYTATLTLTIPKGLKYKPGSGTYYDANNKSGPNGTPEMFLLPEDDVKVNSDGSTIYTWKLNYKDGMDYKLNYQLQVDHLTIQYDASKKANFLPKGVINVQAVEDPKLKDMDDEKKLRTRYISVTVTQLQQVMLAKTTSDTSIEVGNSDPAILGKVDEYGQTARLDDIHYNLMVINGSLNAIEEVRMLDVLPYKNDGRTSTFEGSFKLLNAAFEAAPSDADIYYTTTATVTARMDPNTINLAEGWTRYTSDSKVPVSNIRAIMMVMKSVQPNEVVSMNFSVVPSGQKSGDILANNSTLNSRINKPVTSTQVNTIVKSRDIEGLAWFDDNYDGVKNDDDGTYANVPVELYRTSNDFPDYQNKRVTTDLFGNDITNVKTDSSGNYKFTNLPEGDYIVKFKVDKDYLATIKDTKTSSTEPDTSKINETITDNYAETDKYHLPILLDPMFLDKDYMVPNINAGIIRKGRINVYKYMANLITDANGDFKPDNPEIDLNSDGSLKNPAAALANATFEVREVVVDTETGKELSSTKVGEGKTDETGELNFHLYPLQQEKDESGKIVKEHLYQLIETKAPKGYELLGKKIDVTLKGGQIESRYVPNNPQTKLPFTGTNDIMQGLLIVVGAIFLLALTIVGVKLYQLDDGFTE